MFRRQTLLQRYRWQIAAGVTLLIVETLLIAGLFVSRARWVKGQKENVRLALLAEEAHRGLEEVVSNVPGIVWEARGPEPGAKARFVSDYAEKMLGYGVEEWLSTPGFWLSIIPDEDRGRVAREIEAALGIGKQGVIRFQWMAKNGRLLWAGLT
jgi:PAS domain-containing protein